MPYTMYMRVTTMSLGWPSCSGPAARGAAWNVAALAASVWALFDPRLRLRLTCTRRARLLLFLHDQLPLRWCTPCALTRNALATRVSRFAYVAVVTALTTCMCVSSYVLVETQSLSSLLPQLRLPLQASSSPLLPLRQR